MNLTVVLANAVDVLVIVLPIVCLLVGAAAAWFFIMFKYKSVSTICLLIIIVRKVFLKQNKNYIH